MHALAQLAMLGVSLLNIVCADKDCIPAGSSVFFKTTYYVREDIGSVYGWDSSDPRYKIPGDDEVYGGNATLAYTDPKTGGRLYIAGAHIADRDRVYRTCLGIHALVNLDAPDLHHRDSWHYPHPKWNWYPRYDPHALHYPMIRMPSKIWFQQFDRIEAFIDQQLAVQNTTMIYDGRGCRAAAVAAVGYVMRKTGRPVQEVYDELKAKRPCMVSYLQNHVFVSQLMQLSARRLEERQSDL